MNTLKKLFSLHYLKKLSRSRTAWLGALISALSFVQSIVPEFSVSVRAQALIGVGIGVVIIWLRMDTDHSVEDK